MSRKKKVDLITIRVHKFFPDRGYGFGFCEYGQSYYFKMDNGREPLPSTAGLPTLLSASHGGIVTKPQAGDFLRILPRSTPWGLQAMMWMFEDVYWDAFHASRKLLTVEGLSAKHGG